MGIQSADLAGWIPMPGQDDYNPDDWKPEEPWDPFGDSGEKDPTLPAFVPGKYKPFEMPELPDYEKPTHPGHIPLPYRTPQPFTPDDLNPGPGKFPLTPSGVPPSPSDLWKRMRKLIGVEGTPIFGGDTAESNQGGGAGAPAGRRGRGVRLGSQRKASKSNAKRRK
jgi:hypothetical protein